MFPLRVAVALAVALVAIAPAGAQQVVERGGDLADRAISEVRIEGAPEDEVQLLLNNVRAAVGDPYASDVLRADVNRLYSLGRFRFVTAEAVLADDGTVAVVYAVVPQPIILELQTIGNKAITDQELLGIVRQVRGGPRDDYLIEKATRDIARLYRSKGFYLTDVSVDETDLDRGILIFRIIEGPRVRIKAIEFSGNDAFRDKRLSAEIKTRTHVMLLRQGVLDEDVLVSDVSSLDRFYKARGFLDVRVDRMVELSPDNKEAKVVFVVSEGDQYVLGRVRIENLDRPGMPLDVFTPEQVSSLVSLRPGDVYSRDRLLDSLERLRNAYGGLGYIDVRLEPAELRSGPEPVVDLLLEVSEGERFNVGEIQINGNFLTREKVVRRLLSLEPGRPFDSTQLEDSENRIRATRLFGDVKVTVLEPTDLHPEYRDVLVEVAERNTGSVNFGVALGSDSGVFGEISVVQDNFDLADWPSSLGEMVTGRAFRGAGQRFSMIIRPGNEIFQYSLSLTEPHFLDTDYSVGGTGYYRERVYSTHNEQRLHGSLSLGRRFGDVWEGGVRVRAEQVKLREIEPDAPTEIYEDAGPNDITSIGFTLTRTTVDAFSRPGAGSRFELGLDCVGLLSGGDYNFLNASADYTVFLTLDEDFLGRKSVLKLNTRVGYIFNADGRVPTYEQYYLGGRTFRGFEFRTISPKGIRADNGRPSDDPVGGEWLFFAGAQYEFPLFEQVVSGVFFADTGTVTDEVGFDEYRVSVGAGLRLYIAALGPVPIAFDFGFPLLKEDQDEEQLLSFSAELPF